MKTFVLLIAAGALLAVEVPPGEGLPPHPERQPVIPVAEVASVDPLALLQRRLQQRQHELDARITELVAAGGQRSDVVIVVDHPELDEARAARDTAWRDLLAVLERPRSGIEARQPDPIELAPSRTGDGYIRALEAEAALLVAQVHKDRYEKGGHRDVAALKQGLAALDRVVMGDLPPTRHAERRYLQIWLLIEDLRHRPADERAAASQAIRNLVDEFATRHPDSELLANARWLLESVELEQRVREGSTALEAEIGPGSRP